MAGIRLGTNVDSLAAQSELNSATSSLTQSYERLSSGLRINQASDDAAGLSIASQLNSSSRVYTQAVRNVNDGLSAASIAEGALNALKQISERQLELAEEAANGTYSTKQRGALNKEANALVDEYNRIVASTTFNGMNLFDPALGSVLIQAGYGQKNGTLQLGLSDQLKRAIGDGTFSSGVKLTSGGALHEETTGDFNGDGKLDLVTTTGSQALVYIGNGDGTFQAAKSVAPGGSPVAVSTGDFNGDGKLDLVTANNNGQATVFLGNGDGTFQGAKTLATGGQSRSVTVGDLNGDGTLDIVSADYNGKLTVFIGNGNGTFQAAKTLTADGAPVAVSIGDFNGDGKLDLVSANYYTGDFTVFIGNGNGSFQAAKTFNLGVYANDVTVGDFNGDGSLDFVAAGYNTGTYLFLGNGDGTFGSSKLVLGNSAYSVAAVDFNGDGKLDLVTTGGTSYFSGVQVFLGNGNGTFQTPKAFNTGGTAWSLTIGDFTGDGRADLAVRSYDTTYDANDVQIFTGNGNYATTAPYLNINTAQGARDALNTVNANLSRIEGQLGSIGATTSRFSTALANLQTENENFQAAAGRIEDTDVAQETANLTRTQILQQAAASVLAQANQEPRLALQLLGSG